ncbi:MAG: TIM barrel protein [Candidatus Lindowbacteria bacterium]|nr:TIM barrel protein [Candidatus Lindowbacteria bacterium]
MTVKLAAQIGAWYYVRPLNRVFSEISDLGFDGVELLETSLELYGVTVEQTLSLAKSHSLQIASLYANIDLASQPKTVNRRFNEAATAAKNLCCKKLIIGSPYNPNNKAMTQSLSKSCENLQGIGTLSKEIDIEVAVHPHHRTPIQSRESIDTFLEKTNPSEIGLCIDSGHLFLGDVDVKTLLEQHGDRINHIHLKDAKFGPVSRQDKARIRKNFLKLDSILDMTEAIRPVASRLIKSRSFDFVPLGEGTSKWTQIVEFVLQSGYKNWITFEVDQPELLARQSLEISRDAYLQMCRNLIDKHT